MKFRVILKVLAYLLGIIALTMLIPALWALAAGETEMLRAFLLPSCAVLIPALFVIARTRRDSVSFYPADGILIVFLVWVLTCLIGALPYYLSGYLGRFADAVFESVSGFTTTGSTVIADVESLPRSLLFWRSMTNWLGGMGIVVLTVALLPLLGVGGFQLFKAESPGPEKDKITPKITETAKIVWIIYVALTGLQTLLLVIAGMDLFAAVTHSFSGLSTAGFSVRNASIAAYPSPWISWICAVFMTVGGMNFSLIYYLFKRNYKDILNNSEAKAYFSVIFITVAVISVSVMTGKGERGFIRPDSAAEAVRLSFFQAASIMTTTGFSVTDHSLWPPLAQAGLFFLMFTGGCSGSTAGGIKIIRYVILKKQAASEIKRLLYPKGVFSISLNNKAGRKDVVYGVAAFVFLYFLIAFAAAILISSAGLDILSSWSGSLLSLGNIGLGFGAFGPGTTCYGLPGYVKWGLSFVMITGRLELWTVMAFFSRDFWRR